MSLEGIAEQNVLYSWRPKRIAFLLTFPSNTSSKSGSINFSFPAVKEQEMDPSEDQNKVKVWIFSFVV